MTKEEMLEDLGVIVINQKVGDRKLTWEFGKSGDLFICIYWIDGKFVARRVETNAINLFSWIEIDVFEVIAPNFFEGIEEVYQFQLTENSKGLIQ